MVCLSDRIAQQMPAAHVEAEDRIASARRRIADGSIESIPDDHPGYARLFAEVGDAEMARTTGIDYAELHAADWDFNWDNPCRGE